LLGFQLIRDKSNSDSRAVLPVHQCAMFSSSHIVLSHLDYPNEQRAFHRISAAMYLGFRVLVVWNIRVECLLLAPAAPPRPSSIFKGVAGEYDPSGRKVNIISDVESKVLTMSLVESAMGRLLQVSRQVTNSKGELIRCDQDLRSLACRRFGCHHQGERDPPMPLLPPAELHPPSPPQTISPAASGAGQKPAPLQSDAIASGVLGASLVR
jgi:hypothetical protein